MLLKEQYQKPFYQYDGNIALGTQWSHLIPLPLLHVVEGASFPGLVPPDGTMDPKSTVGIKPIVSNVVFGYKFNEFTCKWLAESFIAWSQIYPKFMEKVSSLTTSCLNWVLGSYPIDQAVKEFEQDLDSVPTNSVKTPECII